MVAYDEATALIVVDMQNDFADPSGSLYVEGGEQVVDRVNTEIDRAIEGGAFVVYTQDWHPESTPHFARDGGIWPVHCVGETWGAEFHPRLEVQGPSVRKGSNGEDGYSGFTMRDPVTGEVTSTALRGMLEERQISKVVVVGLALDYCVKATAIDAISGYDVTLLTGATASVDLEPGDGAKALGELRAAGVRVDG
jgi:nicotinamidase/pyrazinamidase